MFGNYVCILFLYASCVLTIVFYIVLYFHICILYFLTFSDEAYFCSHCLSQFSTRLIFVILLATFCSGWLSRNPWTSSKMTGPHKQTELGVLFERSSLELPGKEPKYYIRCPTLDTPTKYVPGLEVDYAIKRLKLIKTHAAARGRSIFSR